MSKTKNPLYSLGAHGDLGNKLTYQTARGQDTARKTPIPHQPNTINQAYHRWLYQDYLFWWSRLSYAERVIYRTRSSRNHNTQLGEYLKEKLPALPEYAGIWHLDEKRGAYIKDSSKAGNPGTLFGAVPCDSPIGGGYSFDGVDDSIQIPSSPSLNLTEHISVMFHLRFLNDVVSNTYVWGKGFQYFMYRIWDAPSSRYRFYFGGYVGGVFTVLSFSVYYLNLFEWHHIGWAYSHTSGGQLFVDGVPRGGLIGSGNLDVTVNPLILGGYGAARADVQLSDVRLFNETLPTAMFESYSERRYP